MDNGQAILSPTPIVRITAEQLEYLISRINRGKTKLSGLRSNEFVINATSMGSGNIVGINETRKALLFSCTQGGPFLLTGDPTTPTNKGILCQGTTQGPILLSIDDWGWQITRAWYYLLQTVSASALYVAEIFGPPSINDM